MENDFESPMKETIIMQQERAIGVLIEKLSSSADYEDNLNGCSILQDLLEMKDYYVMLC